jgi:hypothetical protein
LLVGKHCVNPNRRTKDDSMARGIVAESSVQIRLDGGYCTAEDLGILR